MGGAVYNVYLPKVDYRKYKVVVFEWEMLNSKTVTGLIGQTDSGDSGASSMSKGTITITNNEDGTLTVVMTDTTLNKEYTMTVTDADIINGTKAGLGIFASTYSNYRQLTFSVPTFTAIEE